MAVVASFLVCFVLGVVLTLLGAPLWPVLLVCILVGAAIGMAEL